MKAFVTGATGLLGNNLVRALRAEGYEVVGLVRSDAKARRLLGDTGATWVVGDMRSPEAFAAALGGCDAVFHTAAYFREYYQPGDHAEALAAVNVRGTLALMALADDAGVRTFVHTSSSGTIGSKPDGSPGDEDTPPPPIAKENLYFRSKVDGDAQIHAFAPKRGMAIIEILPGWMWGPGDAAPTGSGQLAQDFLARKVPAIPPGAVNVVDARDVATGMVRAAERAKHGARFLIAGPPMSLAGMLSALERVSGIPGPRVRLPYALALAFACASEAWSRVSGQPALLTRLALKTMNNPARATSARAERELGVRFRPFDETARDVVAWYRAAGEGKELEESPGVVGSRRSPRKGPPKL
jgi:dihydroflavonol-4-reductase